MTCRPFPATIATRFVPAAVLALLASGCVSMAPDYHRPALPVPTAYSAPSPEAAAAGAAAAAEIGWRTYFPDPVLQTLISTAL
ncbi:RND transporter, partial [Achromobacter insolitus]|nr:RND transporter [Achromobacter insolitus]